MLHRILPLIGLALMATASLAQPASGEQPTGCTAFALSYDRTMVVCRGVPSIRAVSATLQTGPTHGVNVKTIGLNYQIPPWEITGIRSAGSNYASRFRTAEQVIQVQQRSFAVYPRDGITILVERRH